MYKHWRGLFYAQGRVDEAARIYQDAQAWNALAALLIDCAPAMLAGGRGQIWRDWLAGLPADYAGSMPWLWYWQGVSLSHLDAPLGRSVLTRAEGAFAAAGDTRARLLAIARTTGRVRWVTQLERWRNPNKETGPIFWTGPVLANNRLWIASSEGIVLSADVTDGSTTEFADLNNPVSLPPIVANRTLYILDDSGRITAWR